ncbi:MAG: serine hydrolase [Planctomycetaceae bacterium]
MEFEEYRQAWKSNADRTEVTIDTELLANAVRESHCGFQSTINWRDVREVGISILLLIYWVYKGWTSTMPWTWWLTVPALIWVAGYILLDRKRHPQRTSEPGEPLSFYAREALTQVEHQIWLLRNVFWWYLLPFTISLMSFFLQVSWEAASDWWDFSLDAAYWSLYVLVIYGGVYWLNQYAVRTQLEPRRQDLLKLVAGLEYESNVEESDDVIDLVSTFVDPSRPGNSGWEAWAENWNRIIPSWSVVAMILIPALTGAWCGWRFAFPGMGPVFFQSVVAAVIPFEIAFFGRWYLVHRRYKDQPLKGDGPAVPRAPAVFMIAMILVISSLAIAALMSFTFARGPGLEDVSAFVDDDIVHIDDWLQRVQERSDPSLSAIVVRDGAVVYRGAFGVADKDSNEPATTRTQYNVASVTKVFTASLAVMLHEQEVIDLDQTVTRYLPQGIRISTTPERGATITLRQLASHTSGLPRSVPGQVQSAEGRYELEPERLYNLLGRVKLESDPGTAETYSNLGFGLLGHALERAANKSLDQLLQEMLCGPLWLEDTAIEGNSKLRPATGYDWESHGGAKITHSLKERLAGSGGLVTTAEDLGRFLVAQMQPGVFTEEMLKQLHTETMLTDGSPSGTALGWSVRSLEGTDHILEKNGRRSNCSAWIGFSPRHKVGVAIVTNCGGPAIDPIGRRLLEQSIPLSEKKLVTETGYAKVAPFNGVRWNGDQPIVRVYNTWSPLLSINGISTSEIMEFANKRYGGKAHKRFAEDLVEVLTGMGHQPDWRVTLELQNEDGTVRMMSQVLMTKENRDRLWNQRNQE